MTSKSIVVRGPCRRTRRSEIRSGHSGTGRRHGDRDVGIPGDRNTRDLGFASRVRLWADADDGGDGRIAAVLRLAQRLANAGMDVQDRETAQGERPGIGAAAGWTVPGAVAKSPRPTCTNQASAAAVRCNDGPMTQQALQVIVAAPSKVLSGHVPLKFLTPEDGLKR